MLPPFWQYWHQIRDTVVLCGLGDLTRRCCPMSRSPPSWLGTMARFQTLLTLGTLRPCTAVLVPLFPSVLAWHWWMLTGRDSWEEITFQQQMRLIKSYFRAKRKENRLPLMFYFQKNQSHIFFVFWDETCSRGFSSLFQRFLLSVASRGSWGQGAKRSYLFQGPRLLFAWGDPHTPSVPGGALIGVINISLPPKKIRAQSWHFWWQHIL